MLRSPLGVAQAALARPSHCVHTLWAHIEGIPHNAEVEETIFSKKKKTLNAGARTPRLHVPEGARKCPHSLVVDNRAKFCLSQ